MGRPFIVLVTAPITGHRDRSLGDRHQWQTHCPRGRSASCPIKYHGSSVIVSGDPDHDHRWQARLRGMAISVLWATLIAARRCPPDSESRHRPRAPGVGVEQAVQA